ncbi:ZIP family metal transporter [Geodermatophilus sp. TF02-6]|uniref:ZIP family metal transporter n=1 Tax=Geodermatophilus sp. TF02-6 TaxID=2250575 RepID=UPI0018F6AB1B|nr:ZIP family metal transporter [Geodermatophilus sp. TF02-6]
MGTVLSTVSGGVFALRCSSRLRLILGLTAGVVLGVVAFDLLPELFDLTQRTGTPTRTVMVALVAAFLFFHVLEKSLLAHHGGEDESGGQHHPSVGLASALALTGHSFADGIAIGLAFQVNAGVGLAVAVAIIGHDFADGLNTVSLMLAHGNTRRRAAALLVADALAPLAGAASTLALHVPDRVLLLYLGAFTGFLLYIGAAEILPEAHTPRPSRAALGLTVAGAGLLYVITGALP